MKKIRPMMTEKLKDRKSCWVIVVEILILTGFGLFIFLTNLRSGDEDFFPADVPTMDIVKDSTYVIYYESENSTGIEDKAEYQSAVLDTTQPEITLKGEPIVSVKEREKFQDPGAIAIDDCDGDITDSIRVDGYVDIYRPGTYTLTYTVADASGNTAQVTRSVTVERVRNNPQNAVYLTFDDGPSNEVTSRVLDILKENQVKATFFICDYDDSEKALVQRMVNEGHTVGIHGYSHVYSQIYASTSAFMDNIHILKNKLKEDTGYEAFVIRFPGGSSNMVSYDYCPGIMTELVQMVTDENLMYLDWNVSSEDATGQNLPKSQLVSNVVNNLQTDRSNVVLMHDSGAKRSTAEALQEIIDYGKNNGFSFYAVSEETVPVHHGVKN